jgi:pimeloyl-ACP methyl ester carboxylesterase
MKGLFLYGVKCQPWIWNDIKGDLKDYEIDYVVYPAEITQVCKTVEELTGWVYETYILNKQKYDFILGHSMGGIIALQLSALYGAVFNKTILIDSFLVETESVYHNLMTDSHIKSMGEKVFDMLKCEEINYTDSLKASLREEVDYTVYLEGVQGIVYGIYGDRGNSDLPFLTESLNLSSNALKRMRLSFVKDSCHMPMLENPKELVQIMECALR